VKKIRYVLRSEKVGTGAVDELVREALKITGGIDEITGKRRTGVFSSVDLGPCQSAAFFIDHNVLRRPKQLCERLDHLVYDGPMTLEIYNSTGELIKNYTALNQIVAGVPVAFQWDGTNGGATVASGFIFSC